MEENTRAAVTADETPKETKAETPERKNHSFPCESCGNRMTYSPEEGALVCSYCKSKKAIEAPTVVAPEYLYDPTSESASAPPWDEEGDVTLVCPSCGAETVSDADDVTVTCAFCGQHYVSEPHPSLPILRPETMIPHKLSKSEANEKFTRWVKRRYFAPRAFRRMRHTPDMQGVYLPFFTFDSDLLTSFSGQGGRRRTVTYTVNVNGKRQTRTKTVTDWYPVAGTHREFFDDTPFCASKNVDTATIRKLGTFSMKTLNVYNPAYLAGFFAERYTVGLSDGFAATRPALEARMQSAIESALGYDTYRFMKYDHSHERVTFKHILLPVWLSSYRFAGKVYRFMVNGETGRVAGKAPVSILKVLVTVLACLGLGALALWLFITLGEGSALLAVPPAELLPEAALTLPEAMEALPEAAESLPPL